MKRQYGQTSEGNIGNIPVPGRQAVFSSSSIHLIKTLLKKSRGFSPASECVSKGRVKVVEAFFRVSVSTAGSVGRRVCICPWYSVWPCSASLLQCGTTAGIHLVGFLEFAPSEWKNAARVHHSQNWKWEEPALTQRLGISGIFRGVVGFGGGFVALGFSINLFGFVCGFFPGGCQCHSCISAYWTEQTYPSSS